MSRTPFSGLLKLLWGRKQLRYLISPESFGVDQLNALSEQVQAKVLEAFGLAADTRFLKGQAVASV